MAVETERELELVVREEDGTTEIFMENTISGSVLKNNPNLESRKQDKRYHGFGMESIRGDYWKISRTLQLQGRIRTVHSGN
ncbi:MAG: GHKL domain-containing protein [Enterocloster sp.]